MTTRWRHSAATPPQWSRFFRSEKINHLVYLDNKHRFDRFYLIILYISDELTVMNLDAVINFGGQLYTELRM